METIPIRGFSSGSVFQIHKLTDSKKMTVFVISFDGPTLDRYRSQEEQDKFKDWAYLKLRLLKDFVQFEKAQSTANSSQSSIIVR